VLSDGDTATTSSAEERIAELEAELAAARERVAALAAERDRLRDAYQRLKLELDLLKRRIFVARLQGDTLGGESDWIPITGGTDIDIAPAWSPDGNLLYFISERDGFRCIWAQRLHPDSRISVGPPFAVQHFHTGARALLTNFRANPLQIGLSTSERGIVYSLEELRGNIWTMELQ